ncbi:MAG: choice-of-anchor tandem repeat GloVer-containing protein [Candidatus Korobacteraceae bacterium]
MQVKKQFRNLLLNIIWRAAAAALAIAVVFAPTVVMSQSAQAQSLATSGAWTEKVLYSFCAQTNCTDGEGPHAGLIFDAAGNLYGTTLSGGIYGGYGAGTVFELTPTAGGGWTEQVLHSFGNGADGLTLYSGLISDAAGNLYGTTYYGGTYGYGTAFELTPAAGGGWTEQVLYSFGTDGSDPSAGLIFDAAGNLYGTTYIGGGDYRGTVFELTPAAGGGWTEGVLHNFTYYDGQQPWAGPIFDAAGNLYGTTYYGGLYLACPGGASDCGTVFELMPGGGRWGETILHNFGTGGDGFSPTAGLILDAAGNLYGTTYGGGTYNQYGGTVFELTPGVGGWTETLLHSFGNGTDGEAPDGALVFDTAGNLYGTTGGGGTYGGGTVFELTPTVGGGWTEQVLHNFGNGVDGANPYTGLIFDAAGNLYGTTQSGGNHGAGTVFELTPVHPCAKCSHGVLR